MAIYKMDDGIWVNTDKAQAKLDGKTEWDGNQHICVHTLDCNARETLYMSAKGRYYIESWHEWDKRTAINFREARWADDEEVVRWLILNGSAVPEGLDGFTNDMIE